MAKRSRKKNRPPAATRATAPAASLRLARALDLFWLKIAVILAAGLLIYWPVLRGDWLWDDDVLITENHLVHDPAGWWKIWLEPTSLLDFFPLTVMVQWIEWHLFGADTLGYHLVNLALHVTSGLLVWRLLGKFGLKLAWLGGLIFVAHPVMVESVAWIAELKNTLSLPLFLMAMLAYIDFTERGRPRDYYTALALFLAAMLAKATMVMFPVVILLYAWWRKGRIVWADVKASAPFFGISLVIGLLTVWFLANHAMIHQPPQLGGFLSRLACAGLTTAFYFAKCFLPVGPMPMYPFWDIDSPSLIQFLPWPVIIGVLAWLWTKRAGWGRHALLGVGFFLINLVPFMGFTAGSYMLFTWVMDHILYIPIIGLIGLIVAALGDLSTLSTTLPRAVLRGAVVGVVVVLVCLSRDYAKVYVDQLTLWDYEVRVNSEAWLAEANLGNAYYRKGRPDLAFEHYEKSSRLKPDNPLTYYNMGNLLFFAGRVPEAEAQFRHALQINPGYQGVHANLGVLLVGQGKYAEGLEQYREALKLDPDNARVLSTMGVVLTTMGKLDDAEEALRRAITIEPDLAEAHYNLGNTLFQMQRLTDAKEEYEAALRIKPDDGSSHNNLGAVLERLGQAPEAINEFQTALRLNPKNTNARDNLNRLHAPIAQ